MQYEDLLNEYTQMQSLNLRQQEINKPSGGSGFNITIPGLFGGIPTVQAEEETYEEPPYSPATAGVEQEWPIGSGVYWVSTAQHGWE
jgi:hypothetical protein